MVERLFEFLYLFPGHTIIQDVWPRETHGWLHDHFNDKFTGICNRLGGATPDAIVAFAGELDAENGRMFYAFIERSIQVNNINTEIHKFSISLQSDSGPHIATIHASSVASAVSMIIQIEGCPERAVQSIVRLS